MAENFSLRVTDYIEMQELKSFKSQINTNSDEFQQNYKEMKVLVEELEQRLEESLSQGPKRNIEKHLKAGQLLARERVELILDEDSPFLELMPLAGWGQENVSLGGSVVIGIGLVSGVECMVSASVPTIKGGAINEISVLKSLRAAQIAIENCLPCISLIQTAGADLTQQEKVFHRGGAIFRDLAKRSKELLPTISVVFGSSTAGGAYNPGMSDYVIMVKKKAKVFLGGPPLVKMAIGEEVDEESLGGAEMHCTISGVSDFLAQNEHDALLKARQIVANLNWKKRSLLPKDYFSKYIQEPIYAADELLGIVPANIRHPFDCREIIARIVDGSQFNEFKPLYGPTLVTGFAKIHGFNIGIIANNGVLFSECACKGTQFIELCNQQSTPIVFLHNITGFMVGKKYEEGGIIKHGSKFINAVSNSGVPHLSIVIGASYGAGNYGMCGRAYAPRFLFSWPNSRCSVMGPDQLTGVMEIVARQAALNSGQEIDEQELNSRKAMFHSMIEESSNVYFTTSRLIDDGIIDPRDTRNILAICLSIVYCAVVKGGNNCGVSRL
eukprot:TRINITY_DN186_c0_g2_i1.p1 TRINITY_DN186_c0_g2~~TRINITY_DN186_c0_g2_i1.p1  ORF type:complete len:569 (-),score=297.49 TRINITY_DN186_c0_g2_i1:13-1674(-)